MPDLHETGHPSRIAKEDPFDPNEPAKYVRIDPVTGNLIVDVESGDITLSGEVEVKNDAGNPIPVSGTQLDALTDAELRAAPVPVSGPLTDAELLARLPLPVDQRYRLPDTPLVATKQVTTSGVTEIIPTPGPGLKLRVHYIYFTPRGDATSPLVELRFATSNDPLFLGYAAAKTWLWTGAEDEALEANLDAAGNVAVTILYEEVAV